MFLRPAKNEIKIQCLCFDPANASKLMMDLSDEGYDVEEVFQSHKHLNEATQGFREQVFCRNIIYTYNPLLNYAMSNAVIRQNNGLIKLIKMQQQRESTRWMQRYVRINWQCFIHSETITEITLIIY